MTSLKRKASQELTPNTIAIVYDQPWPSAQPFFTMKNALYGLWDRCTTFARWLLPVTYREMAYENPTVIVENHVQSVEPRSDGTTSLKRQKTRIPEQAKQTASTSRARKSRSVEIPPPKKSGRGDPHIEKCTNEEEAREILDSFWLPPEFELSRRKSTKGQAPTTPASLSEEDDDHEIPPRRWSDSTDRSTFNSSTRLSGSTIIPSRSAVRSLRTPDSSTRSDKDDEQVSRFTGRNLVDGLEGLLLGDEEGNKLKPSERKVKKRIEEARLKEIREREAAERAEREKKEAERKLAKERRLYRQQPLKPLVQPLDSKWEEIITRAQYMNNPQQSITKSLEGTELKIKDFMTLLGRRAWLNDEIINGYIEWIVDAANKAAIIEGEARGEPASTVPKFIAHNSFFYENLKKKGPSSVDRLMKRKKAPGTSLLDVDSVLIPINLGVHWTIGVVRPVAKTIEYFDSMEGVNNQFFGLMRSWLKHQLGNSYVEEEWKVPNTGCAFQSNSHDCGVFVCTNAFCVVMGLDTWCYQERDMIQQRRNIAAILINRGFTGDFAWGSGGWV